MKFYWTLRTIIGSISFGDTNLNVKACRFHYMFIVLIKFRQEILSGIVNRSRVRDFLIWFRESGILTVSILSSCLTLVFWQQAKLIIHPAYESTDFYNIQCKTFQQFNNDILANPIKNRFFTRQNVEKIKVEN